jgi:hypothetical protein
LLAGLVAYNFWQMRQSAPRKAKDASPSIHSSHHSESMGIPSEFRMELDLNLHDPEDSSKAADAHSSDKASDSTRSLYKKAGLSPLIDAIVVLRLSAETTGDGVLSAVPGSRRAGSKPFAIEALHRSTKEWESPRAGQRYTSVRVGIQRANRHGPLNEIEFSEFVVKVQALADALKATPEFPDMREEVTRARELDLFASENDAQLSFTLRATKALWSPGYIQQCAHTQGFLPGNLAGRMVLLSQHPESSGTTPVLTLTFDNHAIFAENPEKEALQEVMLLLDVAHVPRDELAYERMIEVAKSLSQAMDGVITNDDGQALTEKAMLLIGKDIDAMYEALAAGGFPAGSPLARRLFS